jgi:hypothetical protein
MASKGGAGSRKRNKDRRKAERKEAARVKRELYAKYGEEGRAKGSKRAKSKAKRLVANRKHETNFCGNSACRQCFPNAPFFFRGQLTRKAA